jgi:hypothetical protein
LNKLHNEEVHNLNPPVNIIRVIKARRKRWTGHVTHIREMISLYIILIEKPAAKRSLGRS